MTQSTNKRFELASSIVWLSHWNSRFTRGSSVAVVSLTFTGLLGESFHCELCTSSSDLQLPMKAWMEGFSEEGSFEWLSRLEGGFQVGESLWECGETYNSDLKSLDQDTTTTSFSAVVIVSLLTLFHVNVKFSSSVLLPRSQRGSDAFSEIAQ